MFTELGKKESGASQDFSVWSWNNLGNSISIWFLCKVKVRALFSRFLWSKWISAHEHLAFPTHINSMHRTAGSTPFKNDSLLNLFVWDRPWTHFLPGDNIELVVLLPPRPKCWDCRHELTLRHEGQISAVSLHIYVDAELLVLFLTDMTLPF